MKVLVIAEDYATLYKVNQKWPGHAVLTPPAPGAQMAHKFGSQEERGHLYLQLYDFPASAIGAKQVMKKWIEELQVQPWSKARKSNDQPAFNWALNKTAGQVDLYLLPQVAFPSGGLYFKNQTWVHETKGFQRHCSQ